MIYDLLAACSITLLSLLGILVFGQRGHLTGTHRYIIPAAIGVFLGVVFFELIPETLEAGGEFGSLPIAIGFISFYLLSYLLHTYHHHHNECHDDECESRAGASMLLAGDAIHNFADGIVIASAFLISPIAGIVTAVGVALHEIPQEIAEFGVLLRAGYTKQRAALYNLLSASAVILGTLLTIIFAGILEGYVWILTGLAAGNLLYIAASDLLPDVHAESRLTGRVVQAFTATLIGMIAIMLLLFWAHRTFDHGIQTHPHSHSLEEMTAEERHEYYHQLNIPH